MQERNCVKFGHNFVCGRQSKTSFAVQKRNLFAGWMSIFCCLRLHYCSVKTTITTECASYQGAALNGVTWVAARVFVYLRRYLTALTTTVSGLGYVFAKDTFKLLQRGKKAQK